MTEQEKLKPCRNCGGKAMRLNNLSMDEQIKYKTRLQAIDKILSAYEKGKIAKLATDKRYSVNAIIFVLTLKRGILRQVLEDITLVINGLSEYADYKSRRKTPVFRHGDIRRIRRKTDVPTVFD